MENKMSPICVDCIYFPCYECGENTVLSCEDKTPWPEPNAVMYEIL